MYLYFVILGSGTKNGFEVDQNIRRSHDWQNHLS